MSIYRGALAVEALSPDAIGGEGWVRGKRKTMTERMSETGRRPLTLGSLPQAGRGGERNSLRRAHCTRHDHFIGAGA